MRSCRRLPREFPAPALGLQPTEADRVHVRRGDRTLGNRFHRRNQVSVGAVFTGLNALQGPARVLSGQTNRSRRCVESEPLPCAPRFEIHGGIIAATAMLVSRSNSGDRSLHHSGYRYTKRMRNQIKALLQERDWTNDMLAEKIGAHTTTVSRLINSRIMLDERWLLKLAEAFDVPPAAILEDRPNVRMVEVRGFVQAGHWAEAWELPEQDRHLVPIPDEETYKGFGLFAVETRGPSMDKRYPEGTVVVFTDQIERGEPLVPGRRYIVERERADGLREATVKTLWRDAEGALWLLPESNDPRFQQPIPLAGEEGDTIRIVGRVVYAVQREP